MKHRLRMLYFAMFFSTLVSAQYQQGDVNGDGMVNSTDGSALADFLLGRGSITGNGDCDLNGVIDYRDLICVAQRFSGQLIATSPDDHETDVAVTRETVLVFSVPLDPASLDLAVSVVSGGETIAFTPHLAPSGKTLTLFYGVLPAASRVDVALDGRILKTVAGIAVDVDGDGIPGGGATFSFETLSLQAIPGTAVCGRVFASEQAAGNDVGLAGVTITVDGADGAYTVATDSLGNFRMDPAPSGRFFVHIDGRTATNEIPSGAYYPFVGKAWHSTPGVETNLDTIYLPLVADGTLVPLSQTQVTEVSLPPAVLATRPELALLKLQAPPDTLYADDGTRGGMLGISPVPPERLPGPLPAGLSPALVITVQTDGPQNFDQPVPVCFPNLPHPETGRIAPPGEAMGLVSFNHDSGRFELVGSMTVSDDGLSLCSDPGQGIIAPGWHTAAGVSGGRNGAINGPGGGSGSGGAGSSSDGSGGNGGNGDGGNNGQGDREGKQEKGGQEKPKAAPEKSCGCEDEDEEAEAGAMAEEQVDPVYLFSGEFYLDQTDLRIPGRGFDFVWARKYRSLLEVSSGMGQGWDYSYHVRIEKACPESPENPCDLILYDGNTRQDRYELQSDGSYAKNEFFQSLRPVEDGYWLVFGDQGRWEFSDPDSDAPAAGQLTAIQDRNGNRMTLSYDAAGKLVTVTDTLGRDIQISWKTLGDLTLLDTVTDFAGRTVRYDHYAEGESGGNPGDLKAVTSPAVTGTPHGNDFPNGKTTSYTYLTPGDTSNPALVGNLVSITDGRRNDPADPTFGMGPYIVNTYNESDQMVRQVWGGDIVDITYEPVFPTALNGNAVSRSIVNDRNGNVTEYWWDRRNRCVIHRIYTGRADPAQPTTALTNRPANPVRADDPPFFETRYEWNLDSKQSRVIHPNGNVTEYIYERDLNPSAPPRSRGNLRTVRHLPGTHTPRGDQEVIEEHYQYAEDFGCGSCSFNFVTRYTDGRGNQVESDYDDRGNLVSTRERIASIVTEYEYNEFGQKTRVIHPDNGSGHRRVDAFQYHQDGPQRGYLHQEIVDAENFALTTTYEYDSVGNVIRVVDPRGNDTLFVVNALNQTVREQSAEVLLGEPPVPVRYDKDFYFDANNNLIRTDTINMDDQGRLQTNTHFSTFFEYDLLNEQTAQVREVAEDHLIRTELAYDGNRNLIQVRYGESTNGNQPGNMVQYQYDERDLVYRKIRAPGTALQSTDQQDYDANGNPVTFTQGLEGDRPRVTQTRYDAYDRPVEIIDAMGNRQVAGYDANHNRTRVTKYGELLDLPGDQHNIRLSEMSCEFDALNRKTTEAIAYFDTATGIPIGDGVSTTTLQWSDFSDLVQVTDDGGDTTLWSYDTANRRHTMRDPMGNTSTATYNANSYLTQIEEREVSDLGNPDQVTRTTLVYDPLDRLVAASDPLGNTVTYGYDSRDNPTLYMDALRDPDGPGNITHYAYDGLDRLFLTTRQLTQTGHGSGSAVGAIMTSQEWDDASRLITQTDGNGNMTVTIYDELNRPIGKQYQDGTRFDYAFDVHDNVEMLLEPAGTQLMVSYDLLNRMIGKVILPGDAISDETTFVQYRYDGLSRMVLAEDNDSLVSLSYNSRSDVVEESLNGWVTSSVYDGESNKISCAYPSGRLLTFEYDALDRTKTVLEDGENLVSYHYWGPYRVERKTFGNGTQTNLTYDGARRVLRVSHLPTEKMSTAFEEASYAWDGMYNKTAIYDQEKATERTFDYDSIYRLRQSQRAGDTIRYELDAVGNRLEVAHNDESGLYALDSTMPDPADFQVNQYTTTPFDTRSYDLNGNLISTISDSQETGWVYNFQNQLVGMTKAAQVSASSGERAEEELTYRYDALGRRFALTLILPDQDNIEELYLYDGHKVVERHVGEDSMPTTFVFGKDANDRVQMSGLEGVHYYHLDDLSSPMALTNASGEKVEQYEYDDFGLPSIQDGMGHPRPASAMGNPFLFHGEWYDPAGLYYNSGRYLDPVVGQKVSRDSFGSWGDPDNLGNGRVVAGNNHWKPLPSGKMSVRQGDQTKGLLHFLQNSSMSAFLQSGKGENEKNPKVTKSEWKLPWESCKERGDTFYWKDVPSIKKWEKMGDPKPAKRYNPKTGKCDVYFEMYEVDYYDSRGVIEKVVNKIVGCQYSVRFTGKKPKFKGAPKWVKSSEEPYSKGCL